MAAELPSYRKVPCWYWSADYKLLSIENIAPDKTNIFTKPYDTDQEAACAGVAGWDAGATDAAKSGDQWLVFCLGHK